MYRNCNTRFTFPAATFARNVVHHGILALFQIVSGPATFSNGLSRPLTTCGTGRDGSQVVYSRILKGAVRFGPFGSRSITNASTLPPGPSQSDGAPRTDMSFTFSQDSLRMKRGHWKALERV